MTTELKDPKEYAAFTEVLASRFAQLSDLARNYTHRLSAEDRDYLFGMALEIAWQRRAQFKPRRQCLGTWWDGCLQAAANTRKEWKILHLTGWLTVKASRLRFE